MPRIALPAALAGLLLALLSGCVTPDPSAVHPASTGATEASRPGTGHDAPVSILMTQTLIPAVLVCDPTVPEQCGRLHYQGTFYISGSWNGTAPYSAYCHYNETAGAGSCVYDVIAFTGAMGDCGTGSVSLHGIDFVDEALSAQGVHFTGDVLSTPQTGTGDLARVTGIHLTWDTYLGPKGANFPAAGSVSCA